MGEMHACIFNMLPDVKIAGIVDSRRAALGASLSDSNWAGVPVFEDFATAAAEVKFSMVDICLPTDLHCGVALQAFEEGKHVFCEKPISLTKAEASAMTAAADEAGRQFMVGHCIRFWPEYVELKRMVDSGEHGQLLSLSMTRRTGRPGYSAGNWVNQPERCLGAALDLHIHDSDFLLHLLGTPEAVISQGIRDQTGWSSITTQYLYAARSVTAEGAWNYPENWGLQMRFTAVFEHAVLDYDSRSGLTLATQVADPVELPMPPKDGYYQELAYFIDCLEQGNPVAICTGEQASASLDLVLAEIESAASGKRISITT